MQCGYLIIYLFIHLVHGKNLPPYCLTIILIQAASVLLQTTVSLMTFNRMF